MFVNWCLLGVNLIFMYFCLQNGFKLGGSQPNSPYEESNKIVNFAASLDQEGGIQNGASVEDVTRVRYTVRDYIMGDFQPCPPYV